jgi:hypothetical protein
MMHMFLLYTTYMMHMLLLYTTYMMHMFLLYTTYMMHMFLLYTTYMMHKSSGLAALQDTHTRTYTKRHAYTFIYYLHDAHVLRPSGSSRHSHSHGSGHFRDSDTSDRNETAGRGGLTGVGTHSGHDSDRDVHGRYTARGNNDGAEAHDVDPGGGVSRRVPAVDPSSHRDGNGGGVGRRGPVPVEDSHGRNTAGKEGANTMIGRLSREGGHREDVGIGSRQSREDGAHVYVAQREGAKRETARKEVKNNATLTWEDADEIPAQQLYGGVSVDASASKFDV